MTTKWINRFRQYPDPSGLVTEPTGSDIIYSFECACPPDSRPHQRMVKGALRNMGEHCWLEDGMAVVVADR